MTRKQIQETLKQLGCTRLCWDDKTLVVYNELQYWLYSNKTPMKAITKIWAEDNEICICLYEDNIFNTGFEIE